MAKVELIGLTSRYIFDPYDLSTKIGDGGMGIVFRGRDTISDNLVAIKVIYRELAQNPNNVERAQKEAKLGINHPNIIKMLDFIEQNGIYHIVSEYLQGVTLEQHITRNGALPQQKALPILLKVLNALKYLHNHDPKVIHRDIKPSNIFLCDNGDIKIMDFGIARITDGKKKSITGIGSVIGTIHYSSPEQVRGRQDLINETSDIYSLGISMYEMLSGVVPFDSKSEYDILEMQIESDIPEHSDIDPGLMQIIKKATDKNQINRFQSASEMIDSIRPFIHNGIKHETSATTNKAAFDDDDKITRDEVSKLSPEKTANPKPGDDSVLVQKTKFGNYELVGIPLLFTLVFLLAGIVFLLQYREYKKRIDVYEATIMQQEISLNELSLLINNYKTKIDYYDEFFINNNLMANKLDSLIRIFKTDHNVRINDNFWGNIALIHDNLDNTEFAEGYFTIAHVLNPGHSEWRNKTNSHGNSIFMALSLLEVDDLSLIQTLVRKSQALNMPKVTNAIIMYGLYLDPNHPTLWGNRRIY